MHCYNCNQQQEVQDPQCSFCHFPTSESLRLKSKKTNSCYSQEEYKQAIPSKPLCSPITARPFKFWSIEGQRNHLSLTQS